MEFSKTIFDDSFAEPGLFSLILMNCDRWNAPLWKWHHRLVAFFFCLLGFFFLLETQSYPQRIVKWNDKWVHF